MVSGMNLQFLRSGERKRKGLPYLVKLHGSVDSDTIVLPTWNKSLTPNIEFEWKKAYELLSSANHIRIIGYSLPKTDSYVQYLFKASALKSENLKSINVICLDQMGEVRKNYDSFISWNSPRYKFYSAKVEDYL
jgi:hypothetical protein